jgi:hypothetical protein
MGAAMESHSDFVLGDGDVGGHIDEVAKDLARRIGRGQLVHIEGAQRLVLSLSRGRRLGKEAAAIR